MGGSWIVTDPFATRTSPPTCVSGATPVRPSITPLLLGVVCAREQDGAGGTSGWVNQEVLLQSYMMTDGIKRGQMRGNLEGYEKAVRGRRRSP